MVFAAAVAGLQPGDQRGGRCWNEMQSAMMKMHEGMAGVEASGRCDADFVRLMVPHHQAAIDMAKTELLYGKDPAMRRLAQEIITGQQSEIELMQLWLKNHDGTGHTVPQTGGTP